MSDFTCTGTVEALGAGSFRCNGEIGLQGNDLLSVIDPVMAAGYIGAGFFTLLPLWAAIIGGRAILRSIT